MNNLYRYIDIKDKELLKQVLNSGLLPKTTANFIASDGSFINGNDLSYLNCGENSSVWKYEQGDIKYALKVFFEKRYRFSLDYSVYESMREIKFNNIVQALNTFKINYDGDYTEYVYDAYLMNYYEENNDYSILTSPVSLLLKNVNNLESDIERLSKKEIVMFDVRCKNTLYAKEKAMFYISDIDMFFKSDKFEYATLLAKNNKKLLNLIKSFFIQETFEEYGMEYIFFLDNYFNDKEDLLSNPTSKRIEKLFSSYDRPKEFFKDNTKRLDSKFYKKYLKI